MNEQLLEQMSQLSNTSAFYKRGQYIVQGLETHQSVQIPTEVVHSIRATSVNQKNRLNFVLDIEPPSTEPEDPSRNYFGCHFLRFP